MSDEMLDLAESFWTRFRRDVRGKIGSPLVFIGSVLGGIGGAVWASNYLDSQTDPSVGGYIVAALATAAVSLALLLGIAIGVGGRTPFTQRDEARTVARSFIEHTAPLIKCHLTGPGWRPNPGLDLTFVNGPRGDTYRAFHEVVGHPDSRAPVNFSGLSEATFDCELFARQEVSVTVYPETAHKEGECSVMLSVHSDESSDALVHYFHLRRDSLAMWEVRMDDEEWPGRPDGWRQSVTTLIEELRGLVLAIDDLMTPSQISQATQHLSDALTRSGVVGNQFRSIGATGLRPISNRHRNDPAPQWAQARREQVNAWIDALEAEVSAS